ncbi:hypothetical protein P154DRAFT_575535 [Amniculicola lignicola CBS 123094]|uniref:BTB domain-containing protein n=1 Tax=Amniculicola lignicola CBS 123094 TaxID=1392246 RepID=A0A6A5WIR4_9PLEO|nr:hypothetical protein P154DRAFT_575535 [Amniculicola lignicola CBS 123094]
MASSSTSPGLDAPGLFNNPALSDIKLIQVWKGQKKEYHAHRQILAGQSQYFRNAFAGNFKEATATEITLHDDDPELFEILLKFVYTAVYDTKAIETYSSMQFKALKETSRSLSNCTIDSMVGLAILSDKYDFSRINEHIALHFSNFFVGVSSWGQEACWKRAVTGYFSAIPRHNTPFGLAIAGVALEEIRGKESWESGKKLIKEFGAFGADLGFVACEQQSLYAFTRK